MPVKLKARQNTLHFVLIVLFAVSLIFASQAEQAKAASPSQVNGLTATPSYGKITLQWSAPTDTGGSSITGYEVHRGAFSGGESLLSSGGCSGLGNVLTCTDISLLAGTTYYYKVFAVNQAGAKSTYSAEVNAAPLAAPPAKVEGLNISVQKVAGKREITLTWSAPASNGSPITAYKIYRTPYFTPTSPSTEPGGTLTSYKDVMSDDSTIYYYEVSAVNTLGEGAKSDTKAAYPTTTTTPPTPPTGTVTPPAGTTTGTYGLTNKPLKDIINGITEWVLGIAAGLTILYLVWGGIYYVTASGDESQVEDAKKIIKYALIGLFVIGISYAVVVTLDKLIR